MESVFPRVGVKQFTELPDGDKVAQLDELAHLVLGIRLYNWSMSKGGVGIEDTPSLARNELAAAMKDVERALATCNELVTQYVDVLLALNSGALHVPAATGTSWSAELGNRRQLAVYLSSLLEEAKGHASALEATQAAYDSEMAELRRTIGARSSIAKDAVYPRFHNIAANWLKIAEIRDAITAVTAALAALNAYIPAALCTLPLDVTRAARAATAAGAVSIKLPDAPPRAAEHAAEAEIDDEAVPSRLSLEHSPEFLQLPLEYQGYCPVALCAPVSHDAAATSAAASGAMGHYGVLIAGDPSLGVVRWRNRHVVCCNEEAFQRFMRNPEYYTGRIAQLAVRNFELVHLLQLLAMHSFPEASLPALIQYDGDVGAAAAAVTAAAGGPLTRGEGAPTPGGEGDAQTLVRLSKNGHRLVDAAVETPVHFVERHVDPHYRWNEWDLRRQALQIMNLRGCKTQSAQTDASHFRRDNATQVYEPREMGTQTGISVATNTMRTVRYVTGLRGHPEVAVVRATAARAAAAAGGVHHSTASTSTDGGEGADSSVAATAVTLPPARAREVTLTIDYK